MFVSPARLSNIKGLWSRSPKRVWLVLGATILASLLVIGFLWGWAHKDDPRFINYAVALVPVALSILIAFVPDLRSAHVLWRIAIVGVGLVWSVLLWKQQMLADKAQSDAFAKAIADANRHTDQQIGKVANKVDESAKHSDEQIGSVKSDFHASMANATGLISKMSNDINSAIEKVGKPAPPELAQLKFSLFGDGKHLSVDSPLIVYPLKPDNDGVFTVGFIFTNTSGVTASQIDFWVYICDSCVFAKEPDGFDKPPGSDEHARHRIVQSINPGASFQKSTFLLKTSSAMPWFDMGFRYSCQTCGPMRKDIQTVRILVLQ
jgi:hypothetical protein